MTERPPGRRIALLHDSPEFGGHERAFLNWLPEVLACAEIEAVEAWVPDANDAFADALLTLAAPKLQVFRHPFLKRPIEPLRARLRTGYARAVRGFVADHRCDLALLLQGRIENLAVPMIALPKSVEIVSYVPMAHSAGQMGRGGVAGRLVDASKRPYYRRPARWIVPAKAVGVQLRRAGATAPIYVVDNVPGSAPSAPKDKAVARMELDLPTERPIALFMGRFDADQKGLDRLIRDITAAGERLGDWTFVFIGRGPAEAALRELEKTSRRVKVLNWSDRPADYLAACNVVLLPSRYEGVPLILLEALEAGVPVLASDIDVFRDNLPAASLRNFALPVDLAAALTAVTTPQALHDYRRHASKIASGWSLERSRRAFLDALLARSVASL